jgi:hypothetical protein
MTHPFLDAGTNEFVAIRQLLPIMAPTAPPSCDCATRDMRSSFPCPKNSAKMPRSMGDPCRFHGDSHEIFFFVTKLRSQGCGVGIFFCDKITVTEPGVVWVWCGSQSGLCAGRSCRAENFNMSRKEMEREAPWRVGGIFTGLTPRPQPTNQPPTHLVPIGVRAICTSPPTSYFFLVRRCLFSSDIPPIHAPQ